MKDEDVRNNVLQSIYYSQVFSVTKNLKKNRIVTFNV